MKARELSELDCGGVYRLKAHAYVAGIFRLAFAKFNADDGKMSEGQFRKLTSPLIELLNWACSRDIQQWYAKIYKINVSLDYLFGGSGKEFPDELMSQLTEDQRSFCDTLFLHACAFILLHELGHLNYGHNRCHGYWSLVQERDADRFAADWLLASANESQDGIQAERINALRGISIALLWLTICNVYFGPSNCTTHPDCITHPESYERLFQTLDRLVEPDDQEEAWYVWDFVQRLLFIYMDNAGFEVDPETMRGHPKDQVNHMIDLLSTKQSS